MFEAARGVIDSLCELAHLICAGRAQTPSVYFRWMLQRYGPTAELMFGSAYISAVSDSLFPKYI